MCPKCGMGRLRARRRSPEYWGGHDAVGADPGDGYWTEARTALFRGALERLEREGGRGRLLDLGGGVGHFAECGLEAGWDAYSMDVSSLAVAAAAERIGPERSLASLPPNLDGSFDAVTLWCVIAHVGDPHRVLEQAVRLLRPGGQLFLTTPNFLFQKRYAWLLERVGRPLDFLAHDHLLHFTPAALERTLRAVGVVRVSYSYVGITEDCLFDRRLAKWLVPVKRAWNVVGVGVARLGLPPLSSELQALGVKVAASPEA